SHLRTRDSAALIKAAPRRGTPWGREVQNKVGVEEGGGEPSSGETPDELDYTESAMKKASKAACRRAVARARGHDGCRTALCRSEPEQARTSALRIEPRNGSARPATHIRRRPEAVRWRDRIVGAAWRASFSLIDGLILSRRR